jgi:hypothetical protein
MGRPSGARCACATHIYKYGTTEVAVFIHVSLSDPIIAIAINVNIGEKNC